MPLRPVFKADSIPQIQVSGSYRPAPDSNATLKRYFGRAIDRIVGFIWWTLTLLGAGSGLVGIFNFVVGLGAWTWFRSKPPTPLNGV